MRRNSNISASSRAGTGETDCAGKNSFILSPLQTLSDLAKDRGCVHMVSVLSVEQSINRAISRNVCETFLFLFEMVGVRMRHVM